MRRRSSILVSGDGAGWALDEEAFELSRTLRRTGFQVSSKGFLPARAVFHMNRGRCLRNEWRGEKFYHGNVGLSYFHGAPGNSPQFDKIFQGVRRSRHLIDGIRVSTVAMENLFANSGFEQKVLRIPIGVDVDRFPLRNAKLISAAKARLGIPADRIVVGSFQKDGDGWDGGDSPKLVKGPDILADTLSILSGRIPEMVVLLAGPARGYLLRRLQDAGIPFIYRGAVQPEEVPSLYEALDLYMVSSRDEGGPKAFLESFASGVPLVATPVGQVPDLADSESAWIASGFDAEELAVLAGQAIRSGPDSSQVTRARSIAVRNRFQDFDLLWREFFTEKLGVQ